MTHTYESPLDADTFVELPCIVGLDDCAWPESRRISEGGQLCTRYALQFWRSRQISHPIVRGSSPPLRSDVTALSKSTVTERLPTFICLDFVEARFLLCTNLSPTQ